MSQLIVRHSERSADWRPVLTTAESRVLRLRGEANRFLSEAAPWRHFATLTSAHDLSDSTILAAFRAWAQRLARAHSAHLSVGFVFAPQARGALHVHALLAPAEPVEQEIIAPALVAAWPLGSATARPIDAPVVAANYLLEHVDLTDHDIRRAWDLNVACPREPRCRRRRSCIRSPGAWAT